MDDNGEIMTAHPQEPDQPSGHHPRFSVIVPAYNVERFIAATLQSVIDQTLPDWELIVVDDGSTDRTAEIVADFAAREPRIAVLAQQNAGCSSASNTAISAASGEFVCILGADDLYRPEYLDTQARFIDENPGYDIYSCNARKLFPDGSTTPYFTDARHATVVSFELRDWFDSCPIFGLAIFRRDMALRLGGYRVDLHNAEDYDFWLRAMASGARHRHNPAELAYYRRHGGNKSGNQVAAARALVRILEDLDQSANLAPGDAAHLARVLRRRRAAVSRRELEARMLQGDFANTRAAFWRARKGFASRARFALALPVVLLSPSLYTRLVLKRSR